MNNFQREGSPSNTYVGEKFEALALNYFLSLGWDAKKSLSLFIGFDKEKKAHRFDIGGIDAQGKNSLSSVNPTLGRSAEICRAQK
ncbi:MAG: hypothetical protein AB1Z19_04820 [Eubacteriales bacterium]